MRVSVVVPTYRRPDLLDRCLAALAAQEFDPSAYEVIVADDAGERGDAAAGRGAGPAARPIPIRYARRDRAARPGRGPERRLAGGAGRGHRLHRRRLHPRPALAGRRASPPSTDGARRGDRPGRRPAARAADRLRARRRRPGAGRVRHGQLLLPPRRPGGRRRLRRAVRRRLARGQRPALRPAGARAAGSSGPRARSSSTRSGRPPGASASGSSARACSTPCSTRNIPTLYRRRIRPAPPWDYYAIVAALARPRPSAAGSGHARLALAGAGRLGGSDGPVLRPAAAAAPRTPRGTSPRWS